MSHAFMMFYPGDYLRDTGHLSTEEHGAYLLLLWHAWTQNGILPLDDELLRRITRLAPKAWAKSRAIIMAFFTRHDDGYHQKRLDKELARARSMVAKRREAVERTQHWRAANPRQKPNGHGPPNDPPVMHNVMHNEDITDAQQTDNVMPLLSVPEPVPVPTSQLESESKKVNKNTYLAGTRARAERPADGLEALMDEAGIEKPATPRWANDEEPSTDPLISAHIRRAAKACEMRVPYATVRSRSDQITAAESPQPPVVDDCGYRWAPAPPIRTVEEQLAELERMMRAEAATSIAAE